MSLDARIYHNPRCSKSRQTLQLLRDHGVEPEIIEYLNSPLTANSLQQLADLLQIEASDLLRRKEALFKEICPDGNPTNAEAIKMMCDEPRLMERPIVVCGVKAVIGRPPENVLQLL